MKLISESEIFVIVLSNDKMVKLFYSLRNSVLNDFRITFKPFEEYVDFKFIYDLIDFNDPKSIKEKEKEKRDLGYELRYLYSTKGSQRRKEEINRAIIYRRRRGSGNSKLAEKTEV